MNTKVKVFGNDVDLKSVSKLVMVIVGVFSLSNYQEKQIDNYVKLNHMVWVEKNKQGYEIEEEIRKKINEIK